MFDDEIYVDIIGFEGEYQISNYGNVYSIKSNIILKKSLNIDGYNVVRLSINGITLNYRICRLVAIHFISNPNNNPIVNHIDGIKTNDYYKNLEWCDYSLNAMHSLYVLNNIKSSRRILEDYEVMEIYNMLNDPNNTLTQTQIAEMYNTSQSVISSIKLGKGYNDITNHFNNCPVKFLDEKKQKTYPKINMSGENNPANKISEQDVIEIYTRCNKGESQSSLAREFGISQTLVYYIKNGIKWGEVTKNININGDDINV